MFRRDIFGLPHTVDPGPDTRCTGVASTALEPFPRVTFDTSA